MDERTINNEVTMGGAAGALLAGRYRVVRPLGQGGMGSVWLAEDAQLENRPVAIKMLPSILVSNKRAYNQLKAEALVSLKLTHPNIATVRAFEENAGNPFLVVDYVDGQTLDDYLAEKGKLSEEETIRLLMPVAAALDYAHGEGVVHRDVKPANVMIRKDGHPFVLDFGIAREIQETLTRVTGKLSSGTLMYMSPEQLNGDVPSAAQDVYSFAVMVYECLTGAPPFVRGLVEDQIKSKIPTPIDPHIAICGSVMAGLEKRPEDRPASCVAALKRVEGSGKRVEGLGTTTNYVLVALLAAGLVLAGGGFWWYSERKQDRIQREAESARQRERVRIAEEKRIAEAKRRVAEEERRIAEEEQRIAREKAIAEEKQRIAAEKQRIADEERRMAEERRVAEEKRIVEEKRTAEKRAAEERGKAIKDEENNSGQKDRPKNMSYPYEARYRPYYLENGQRKNVTADLDVRTPIGLVGRVENTAAGQIAVLGAIKLPSGAISVTLTCGNRKGRFFVSSKDLLTIHNPKDILLK